MYCFETAELKQEFFNLTGLEVSRDDGLPQHICHICRGLLRKATEFRKKCHSTYALLSSHPVTLEFIQKIHGQALQNTDIISVSFDRNSVDLPSDVESDSENYLNNDKEESDIEVLNSQKDTDSKWATDKNFNSTHQSDDDLTTTVDENAKNSIPPVETKSLEFIQHIHGQTLQNMDFVSVTCDSNSADLQSDAEKDTQNHLNKDETEEKDYLKSDVNNHIKKEDPESDLLNSYEDTNCEWATDNNLNDNDQSDEDFTTEADDEFDSMANKIYDEPKNSITLVQSKSVKTEADTLNIQYSPNNQTMKYNNMLHEYIQEKYVSKTFEPGLEIPGCPNKMKLYNYMTEKYDYNGKDIDEEKECNEMQWLAKKYNFKVEYFSKKEQIENLRARMNTDKYKLAKFKCSDCYTGFQSKDKYNAHRARHDSATYGNYKCGVCKLRHPSKMARYSHMRYHMRRLICNQCNKSISISSSFKMQEHFNIHNNSVAIYKCEHCSQIFTKKASLHQHVYRKHGTVPCGICHFMMLSHGVDRHMIRQHPKTFTCSSCNKVFNDYAAIAKHIHTSPNGVCGADAWPCTECGENFNTESDLREHGSGRCRELKKARVERERAIGIYKCEWCSTITPSVSRYRRHVMIHTGERPHACPECPKAFRLKAALKEHMVVHTGERAHQCSQCGKAYAYKNNLSLHRKIAHEKLLPHECTICSKKFLRSCDLKAHLNTVHKNKEEKKVRKAVRKVGKGVKKLARDVKAAIPVLVKQKNIICEWCSKPFSSRKDYRIHTYKHTGERPHPCPECPKAFRTTRNLKRHMALHTGERAHQCPQCEKAYTSRSHLKYHHRTVHENLRPHKCTICSKKYRHSHHLRKHLNTIHKNEEEKKVRKGVKKVGSDVKKGGV